jgi:hypothetical protein
MKSKLFSRRLAFLPLIFLAGCAHLPGIASALQTADSVGRAVAHVAGWCEENGAKPADVLAAVESARRGDYDEALRLASVMVSELRKDGVELPDDKAALLDLAQKYQAARAIEQAARALAGRDSEGKLK